MSDIVDVLEAWESLECTNALIATAKRLPVVSNAMDRESGLRDFISVTAQNAPERESVLVLSAAGQAPFKLRHNQTDAGDGVWNASVYGEALDDSADDMLSSCDEGAEVGVNVGIALAWGERGGGGAGVGGE